jgi:hypothetical protein
LREFITRRLAKGVSPVKPMDSHYCPICGNMLPENTTICLHCAAPIGAPKPEKANASGCLSVLALAILFGLAIALITR